MGRGVRGGKSPNHGCHPVGAPRTRHPHSGNGAVTAGHGWLGRLSWRTVCEREPMRGQNRVVFRPASASAGSKRPTSAHRHALAGRQPRRCCGLGEHPRAYSGWPDQVVAGMCMPDWFEGRRTGQAPGVP